MAALKGKAADAFLRRPDRPLVLLFGPDSGLVSERSAALLAAIDDDNGDPFARLTLDGDALAGEPARLAEEVHTVPLFGGRRAIRVTATSRNLLPALTPLLSDPPTDALIVVEAGDLKPRAPLRQAFEAAECGAAIGCYSDDRSGLVRLIEEEERNAGVTFSSDARAALQRLIGADRLASRGELAKISLYCHPGTTIEAEDVAAIIGDGSDVALDELADAVGLGDAAASDRALAKLLAEGMSPAAIVSALARHFRQLSDIRQRIDNGATAESAMRAARPPIFFKRQNAIRRQVTIWTDDSLGRACELIASVEAETRRMAQLAEAMVGRCVLTLARASRPRQG
jgi:DNA polymerase III subunit delta